MQIQQLSMHFWLIELHAYWEGGINTSVVRDYFSISRQQANKYIQAYRQKHAEQLSYNPSAKAYQPTELFALHYISGDVTEYLNWLDTRHISYQQQTSPQLTNTSFSLPKREVSPFVMRGLVSAIKQSKRLDVEYVSLSNPNNQGRIIQPHVFVKTGLRWHLRAYCEDKKQFRDFVLSRFRGQPELMDKATHTSQQDMAWHTQVELQFIPDPRLTGQQQAVLAQDYQMQNGMLTVITRAALAQYLIQEMQVNIDEPYENPTQQQLILHNKQELMPWLFSLHNQPDN